MTQERDAASAAASPPSPPLPPLPDLAAARSEPAHRTTDELKKLVPLTVSVKAPSPANLAVGEMLVVVGTGFGGATTTAFASVSVLLGFVVHASSEYATK